jgi:hypothetical protein
MPRLPDPTQPKTLPLPPELLSTIFQHACPTSDVFDEEPIPIPPFHLALRLVSTLWYDVVQSTPQLWTFIFLPKLHSSNVDIKGRYLKLCLESSGGLPLTLFFRFDEELREVGSFISPTVDTTLELMAHRVGTLRLSRAPRTWMEELIPKMCQLAMMHIDNPDPYSSSPRDGRDQRLFLPETNNINRIYIVYPRLFDICFHGVASSVTRVDFYQCPIDCIMEILLQCPNLIEIGCLFPVPASKVTNPRTMFTSPLVLSHLSEFTWCTNRIDDRISEWDTVLFEHLHFPSLQRFDWLPGECSLMDDTPLALPLSRFPKSVTALQLAQFDSRCRQGTLRLNHFLSFTGVTALQLLHGHMDEVFTVLSHGTDQSSILFPKLTLIELNYWVIERTLPWPVFGPKSGHQVVQMLQSRAGLIKEFTLVVEMAHLTRNWDDEVWNNLRELKRNGLDLTIIEYEHTIII